MGKYELSLATDYVSKWTFDEAVREIFQNAIDAGNYAWNYNPQTQILSISNDGAQLEPQTLLLGCTSKSGDDNTIGQFGEGYKLALLVLTRSGKCVKIYNGKSREVWLAKLVNSRRYKTRVLTIFTEKLSIWEKPEDKVTFEIEGILEEEFETTKSHNLHVEPPIGEVLTTSRGRILKDASYKGRIYVNGLYVCNDDTLSYGYDFKPQYVQLDRDRTTVRTFDVRWETSAMWLEFGDEDECIQLCIDGKVDVQYLHSRATQHSIRHSLRETFHNKYGQNAVPCGDQGEVDEIRGFYPKCKPVVASETTCSLLREDILSEYTREYEELSIREKFEKWYEMYVIDVGREGEHVWQSLLDELN